MPPARNEATLSFCQASRSVRMMTAILVSNCMISPDVIPGRCKASNPESRDSGFASSTRPGMTAKLSPLGVAGPGADDAFLAAEFVALLCRGVERARNFGFYGIAMRAAGISHVDGERGASPLHGDGSAVALALLQRGSARDGLGGIVIGLAIGTAFADGECARRPCPGDVARDAQYQGQRKDKERAALRRHGRNDQEPLPRGNEQNLAGRKFQLGEREVCRVGKAKRAHQFRPRLAIVGTLRFAHPTIYPRPA